MLTSSCLHEWFQTGSRVRLGTICGPVLIEFICSSTGVRSPELPVAILSRWEETYRSMSPKEPWWHRLVRSFKSLRCILNHVTHQIPVILMSTWVGFCDLPSQKSPDKNVHADIAWKLIPRVLSSCALLEPALESKPGMLVRAGSPSCSAGSSWIGKHPILNFFFFFVTIVKYQHKREFAFSCASSFNFFELTNGHEALLGWMQICIFEIPTCILFLEQHRQSCSEDSIHL